MQQRDAERILGRADVDETRPLSRRYRSGATSVEAYLASRTGPLAYMVRLRRIEDAIAEHERRLERVRRLVAVGARGDAAAFAAHWRRAVEAWSFVTVNALIDQHNRWYPAESRLPMDPRTGDFVAVDGRSYRIEALDAAWALRRFPPELRLVED